MDRKNDVALNEPWLKGQWNEIKGKLQEEWGKLTNDQLDQAEGRRDQVVGAIQKQYGLEKHQAEKQVAAWERRHGLR